ncbi:MAG: hypothetical protein QW273_00735 [Candidatus Pacearchaeota archaeon]
MKEIEVILGAKFLDYTINKNKKKFVFMDSPFQVNRAPSLYFEYTKRMLNEENLRKAAQNFYDSNQKIQKLFSLEDIEDYAKKVHGLLKFNIFIDKPKVIDMKGKSWWSFENLGSGRYTLTDRIPQGYEAVRKWEEWNSMIEDSLNKGYNAVILKNLKDGGTPFLTNTVSNVVAFKNLKEDNYMIEEIVT